jgi:two-component system, OmpR family, sensor histidine kinase VicK
MTKRYPLGLLLLVTCFGLLSCMRHPLVSHYSESIMDSAVALGSRGMPDQAIRLVDSHYATFPAVSVKDRYRYYRFRFDLYDGYYSVAYNPRMALLYADSMARILKDRGLAETLPEEYAMAFNLQGQIYIELKNYPEAFYVFGLCRVIAEKAGDSCMVGQYNSTMGTVRFRQGEYIEAAALYKRALALENNCTADADEYHDIQGCLDNTALAFTRAGQTDSALVYYRKAADYIIAKRYLYTRDTVFPQIALAVVYGNEALAVKAAGDTSRAEALLKKAIAINSLPGRDNSSGVIDELHLAQLYLELKRNAEAAALLRETQDRLPADDDGTKKLWLTLMWKYDEASGKAAEAIMHLKAALQLTDSMALKDRYRYAENEDNVYQLVEANYTIDLLRKNSTIKGMSLAIAVLAVLAAASIALLILNNLRRHKRMLAVMTAKNEAISRHEAQLERLLQELDEKNKEKDRILRVVAHDLRSPVGGIKMMTGLLLKNSEPKQAEMLSFIRRSAINCLDLVNELLSGGFSGEAIVLDRSVFDLTQLVGESAQLMQFNAAEKGQVIDAVLPEGKQPILADAAKLGRVLNNILGNAIKFSPTDSRIIITLTAEGKGYRVTIRDHGMGIPAAAQKNVFDVFTLSRRTGTQGEKSFGLGLSISKQIIEAHEGRIWFESEEGKGTEFFIEVPAVV